MRRAASHSAGRRGPHPAHPDQPPAAPGLRSPRLGAAGLPAHLLYRWRLKEAAARVVARTGRPYVVALAGSAIVGAWAFEAMNTAMMAVPHPSHSIAGGLAGAIMAVELRFGFRIMTGKYRK